MTNIGKQCIFLLITLVIITGCCKQTPSPLNDPNSSKNSLPSSLLNAQSPYDAPLPSFSTPVTPDEVRQAFYTYSAPAIVEKLAENNYANWDMIMEKISNGDAQWILYGYKYIRPGTDAGATEQFPDALAYALVHNPEAVLSLDGIADTTLSEVCGWPFIGPEWDFVLRYGKEALAAVRKIDNPDLLESRDMCIRELERGFATMKRLYWKGEFRPY